MVFDGEWSDSGVAPGSHQEPSGQTPASEMEEERRKIRRFQLMMDMVAAVIAQSPWLTVDEAAEMVGETERVALNMFPEKALAYWMIYKPRLQRVMRERYRIQ